MEVIKSDSTELRPIIAQMIDFQESLDLSEFYLDYREEDGAVYPLFCLCDKTVAMKKPDGTKVEFLLSKDDVEINFGHIFQSPSSMEWYRVRIIQRFPYGVKSMFNGAKAGERLYTMSGATLCASVLGITQFDGFITLHFKKTTFDDAKRLWLQYSKSCNLKRCVIRNCLKKCEGCRLVRYCSRAHQREDWKQRHNNKCCMEQPEHRPSVIPDSWIWIHEAGVVTSTRSMFYVPNYTPGYAKSTIIKNED